MSSKINADMNVDPANQQEKFVLGTWDIVAVVGYFVVILGVGMLVCIYYVTKNKYQTFEKVLLLQNLYSCHTLFY